MPRRRTYKYDYTNQSEDLPQFVPLVPPGWQKVVWDVWSKTGPLPSAPVKRTLMAMGRHPKNHRHDQYGSNRSGRRQNSEYRLHVKGWWT